MIMRVAAFTIENLLDRLVDEEEKDRVQMTFYFRISTSSHAK